MSAIGETSTLLYGLAAEFDSADAITAAARRVSAAGYTRAEAYTPFAIEGLSEELGFHRSVVAPATLIAGIIGGITGFMMCWYANVINYPWNIGGRPPNSWPAWIPLTFELTVLFAALTAAIVMIASNGHPRLHHPIFNTPRFDLATRDRFFLCIEAADPQFDPAATRRFLESLGPIQVSEVPF